MGVEDFYGRWLMSMFNKYPLLRRPIYQIGEVHSTSIDMNGLIHAITPEVYAYGKIDDELKQKRKAEIRKLIGDFRWKISLEEYANVIKKDRKKFEIEEDWLKHVEKKFREDDVSENFLFTVEDRVKDAIEDHLFQEFCDKLVRKIEEIASRYRTSYILNLAVDGPAPWAKIQQQRYRRFKAGKLNADTAGILTEDFYYFNASANITPGTEFMDRLDKFLENWVQNRASGYLRKTPRIVRYSSYKVPGEGEHKIFADYRDAIIENVEDKANILVGKDADLLIVSCISPLKNIFVSRENYGDNINIEEMKRVILSEMNFEETNERICIQDFILISFFVGNDFLPRIYQFKNVKASLEFFLKLYKLNKKRLTNEKSEIIWENFYNYLSHINKKSSDFFYSILDEDWFYPPKMLTESLNPQGINMDLFASKWYSRALKPISENGNVVYDKMFDFDSGTVDPDDIRDMTNCYLLGLQWILRYYTSNDAKKDYLYPYLYAPLLDDILKNIEANISSGRNIDNGMVSVKSIHTMRGIKTLDVAPEIPQQLVVTIPPPMNQDILDKKLYSYVVEDGALYDMTPISFEEELDTISAGKEHQGIVFLPVCDPLRITSTVDNRRITREMKEMLNSKNIITSQINPTNYNGMYVRGRGRGERVRGRGRGTNRSQSQRKSVIKEEKLIDGENVNEVIVEKSRSGKIKPEPKLFVVEDIGNDEENYEYENDVE